MNGEGSGGRARQQQKQKASAMPGLFVGIELIEETNRVWI